MTLKEQVEALKAQGYSEVLAQAKIVHDVLLLAIAKSGFKASGTLKGGVVMSALTKDIRRATMDMDVDFIRHSIGEAGVRRFVARLQKSMPNYALAIRGPVADLKHEDYRGKRIFLSVKDASIPRPLKTKMDIGVHTHEAIRQVRIDFDTVSGEVAEELLANPAEQIFTEKLLSLLKHGVVSNRPKDVFDLYYLAERVSLVKVRACVKELIYANVRCRANNKADVVRMLDLIFTSRPFVRRLANTNANWLQVEPTVALAGIIKLVKEL